MSGEGIPVGLPCRCPGTPHEEDTVYLRPKLGLAAGIALQSLIVAASQDRPEAAEITGKLAEAYLLHGVESWTFVGEDGPIMVNPDTIRSQLLEDFERGAPVADAADDLYMAPVIAPLLAKARKSLLTTPTNGSTSVSPNGSSKRRKPSKRSSTSTSPMAATATTST